MKYSYGARIDNDSNAVTIIDEENETAVTTGYVNGEYVEFGGEGGGSSDFSTAQVIITETAVNTGISGGIIVHPDELVAVVFHTSEGVNPITLLLYKGVAQLSFETASPITEYSGNFSIDEAEQDGDTWYTDVSITGDCSVTVTGKGIN